MEFEMNHLLTESFLIRLLIDLVTMLILVRLVYHKIYKKKDFFFTFFLFNLIIYVLTYMLNKVELSFGAAFGLFAVFSLLRYRTENISPKDMTYLFVVIALGLITSVSKGTYIEIALLNLFIVAFVYALDGNLLIKNEMVQIIQYENIQNIKPVNHGALIEDLKNRTGLDIHKIEIESIDFLKDTARIKVYYYEK
ncbi:MAG: DUF4956 domain-containing protein [Chryseolinea sp.]